MSELEIPIKVEKILPSIMKMSEQINELALSLSIAQGQIEAAKKDAANPFFKSKYADLASVWSVIREPFSKNGLSVIQCPDVRENKVIVETILMHKSGQWIASCLPVPIKDNTVQGIGSCISYAKRYSLKAICGVSDDEGDDDGEAAMGRNKPNDKPTFKVITAEQEKNLRTLLEKDAPNKTKIINELKAKFKINVMSEIATGDFQAVAEMIEKLQKKTV